MSSRVDFICLRREIEKNSQIEKLIDLRKLQEEINLFYNRLNLRSLATENIKLRKKRMIKIIGDLLIARSHLDNCIAILKGTFELDSNPYLKRVNKDMFAYQGLVAYLGIANSRLDMIASELKDLERNTELFTNSIFPTWIESYKATLNTYMQSFVINSLKNAIKKFNLADTIKDEKTQEEKKIVKDTNFFFYLLFYEVYLISEIEGAIARQVVLSKFPRYETAETKKFPPPSSKSLPNYADIVETETIPTDAEMEQLLLGSQAGGEYESP
jgi:hypothetical protein